jgi:indolepyruvate ferredoxin oxidoreductase beta subunit
MEKDTNVLIVGVGGQGVLLASELLSAAAVKAGYDAKKSEVHGMSQRGGVVSSHVRFGQKIFSPLIPQNDADVILAFEQAEALRWSHFLKQEGIMILNHFALVPPIASLKGFEYPYDALEKIQKKLKHVKVIDAVHIAQELGNLRLINTILLGVLSVSLNIEESIWKEIIHQYVPKGTENLNERAFEKGRANG